MGHAEGEGRDQGEGRATIYCVHSVVGFPLYDGFNTLGIRAEKSRYPHLSFSRLFCWTVGMMEIGEVPERKR
jgi:hypothetical protein